MDAALSLDRVEKRYGELIALSDVSFDARAGEMFGLIGPDGAGKTTAIRLLCGLIKPDRGSVRVLGLDPARDHRRVTSAVGYLSQRFSLYGDLSIDENIAFFAAIHGMRRFRERRDQLLEMTQLTTFRARLADQLSGGMKQKLALACTLIHEPKVLLLDEPTTGVDPVSRREFWKLLSQFLASGVTILMSTPYLDEAERCARVALVHEGRLLALDDPTQLRRSLPGQWFEIAVSAPREAVRRLTGADEGLRAEVFGDRLHVWLDQPDRAAAEAEIARRTTQAGLTGARVRPMMPSLEDVFIAKLTGSRQ
jgi:ABC-2 type transport system ATP-binding protein